MMKKLKIAVLFGGCSSEYEVSLQSACAVITHLDREKYEAVPVGITRGGEWFRFYGPPEKIKEDRWQGAEDCVKAVISPDRAVRGLLEFAADGLRTLRLDAAMPVLHGKNGEDGTVQGLLELAGIPAIGCGTLCSALCMDKDKAHRLAALTGVRVPRAFVLGRDISITIPDRADFARRAAELGYPLFVKPLIGGSSIGITKVADADGLPAALALAFRHSDAVIVEENIPGFEVGCAILGNEELTVGEVDEIELSDGFFDFREKYTLDTSAIHVPARIAAAKAAEIKLVAQKIYRALGCRGFARVDMFLTPSGEIVFNEVNTIPGFTAHSRFPNMLKAAGKSFAEIVDAAVSLAVGV